LAASHADEDAAFLAIILPPGNPLDGKRVAERQGCLFKSYAIVVAAIGRGFLVIPFKSD